MRGIELRNRVASGLDGDTPTAAEQSQSLRFRRYGAIFLERPDLEGLEAVKLTLRAWNQQLRLSILVTDGCGAASLSPQEGLLHEKTELDSTIQRR
jgi:hypothetical protein